MKRSQQLIEQYKILHETVPSYGSAATFGNRIWHMIEFLKCKTILDYGCGKGGLIKFLKKKNNQLDVKGFDPAVPEYSDDSFFDNEFDFVVCNDVLEHIPECDIGIIINNIFNLTSKGVFFNISCREAAHKLPNGDNCHETVKPKEWWIEVIAKLSHKHKIIVNEYNENNHNLVLALVKFPG